ncbi:MAG: flagella basal body P-ring formation protein FlgA, partial [Fervidobacterium sp.]
MNHKILNILIIFIYFFLSINVGGYYVSFKSEVSVFPGAIFISELISETDLPITMLEKIIVGYLPNGGELALNKRYLINLIKRIEKTVDSDIDDV